MMTLESQRHWLNQHVSSTGDIQQRGLPDWLERIRENANSQLDELPLLDRKQEKWRYTNIENILQHQFHAIDKPSSNTYPQLASVLRRKSVTKLDSYQISLINGRFLPQLSAVDDLPEGVIISSMREALLGDSEFLSIWFGAAANHHENIFTALNTALVNDGVFVHIAEGVNLERAIEIVYLSTPVSEESDNAMLLQPRNVFVLGDSARATIIERFIGDNGDHGNLYFHNQLNEIMLGKASRLIHPRIQDESRDAYHYSSVFMSQHAESEYYGTYLGVGAAWSRTEYYNVFKQAHARCEINGLSVVSDKQLMDVHLQLKHESGNCVSRERFKTILMGRGRAVFDGHVRVEQNAQHSDAQMSSDNLMLSRDAEIDCKPQLEIYADDVKCSHGASVGELDENQVFYLRSRGIEEAKARALLSMGFANEILEQINNAALRDFCCEIISAILHRHSISDTSGS